MVVGDRECVSSRYRLVQVFRFRRVAVSLASLSQNAILIDAVEDGRQGMSRMDSGSMPAGRSSLVEGSVV